MPINKRALQNNQANLLGKQIPLIWLINIFMPVVLIIGIWDPARSLWMQSWLGLIFGVSCLRFIFHRKMYQWALAEVTPLHRMHLLTALSAISGIAWGCSALLLGDDSTSIDRILLAITLLLMTGGSMASLGFYYPAMLAYTQPGFYYPAMLAYALPALLPQTFFMLFHGDQVFVSIGGIMLAFTLFCLFIARNSNRTLLNSMHLQLEKDQLLEQVHKQKALIEEASLAKTRFLAAASHDLRQPLHAITLLLGALKFNNNDTDRAVLHSKIDTSMDNLTELFDALLDISKLDAAAIEVNPQTVALAPIFRRLQQQFQAEADAKGLTLRVRAAGQAVVYDPLWLQRILGNLLSNALRYTESGGVILAARARGSEVEIQVWDSGRGIPAQDQQRIFIEFEQLHNSQRDRSQGIGLGLSIVSRLTELLGHAIALRSATGQGAMFSIRCPATTQAPLDEPAEPVTSHPDRLRGSKVLLIDDEATVRDSMTLLLSKWHCEVRSVGSIKALEELMSADSYAPDIIISDYRLQDNDTGVQALDVARGRFENPPPGILISGDTAPERITQALASGYPLLHKPVKPAQLRTCLNRALIG
jgi:signal transduction histidine kinase/CheY-like chemotaxis protein